MNITGMITTTTDITAANMTTNPTYPPPRRKPGPSATGEAPVVSPLDPGLRRDDEEERTRTNQHALTLLMTWLSPSFPVGAYSFSHGLEWAVEDGTVRSAADLRGWIADVLEHGAGRTDAVLFAHAWRAAFSGDHAALASLNELANAFQPSRERHLEATAQGRAFASAIGASWRNDRLAALLASLPPDLPPAYPVAVAIAAAAHGIALLPALSAYLHAFLSNLVSAGIRAVPLGQTEGQRTIAALLPLAHRISADAMDATLDDLGGAALRADIASMKHETQYTRLFRS
jgi:urease accessory protein